MPIFCSSRKTRSSTPMIQIVKQQLQIPAMSKEIPTISIEFDALAIMTIPKMIHTTPNKIPKIFAINFMNLTSQKNAFIIGHFFENVKERR